MLKILNNWWGLADMGMPNPSTEGIRVIIVSRLGKQWETLKSIMEENGLHLQAPENLPDDMALVYKVKLK